MADAGPDRYALLAAQDAWAAAQVAPPYVPAKLPDHGSEILASHPGQPSVQVQDRRNGAGLPAPDRGSQWQ